MTHPQLLKKAQIRFNEWIRFRDMRKGCISCCSNQVQHASHYFSAGQHSALRFNETNVNGSCIKCNTYLHGNLINYRKGLVTRYGEKTVKILELNADLKKVKKWSRFELEQIILTYTLTKEQKAIDR